MNGSPRAHMAGICFQAFPSGTDDHSQVIDISGLVDAHACYGHTSLMLVINIALLLSVLSPLLLEMLLLVLLMLYWWQW